MQNTINARFRWIAIHNIYQPFQVTSLTVIIHNVHWRDTDLCTLFHPHTCKHENHQAALVLIQLDRPIPSQCLLLLCLFISPPLVRLFCIMSKNFWWRLQSEHIVSLWLNGMTIVFIPQGSNDYCVHIFAAINRHSNWIIITASCSSVAHLCVCSFSSTRFFHGSFIMVSYSSLKYLSHRICV